VFCIDTEWVETVDGSYTAIEIAVYDLNGTKIVDDPIDLGISVETLLAGVSQENPIGGMRWGTARKIYGNSLQTFGLTKEKIRERLCEAGMNSSSLLLEWSTCACDRNVLKAIMGKDTPKSSILMPVWWRKVLPGFPTMRLPVFYSFMFPDSKLYLNAHRAGPDTMMLIQATRRLIELADRDGEKQSNLDSFLASFKKILDEQNWVDNDDDDSKVPAADVQEAEEEEVTEEDREIVDCFVMSAHTEQGSLDKQAGKLVRIGGRESLFDSEDDENETDGDED
jgi:hypothetical protein